MAQQSLGHPLIKEQAGESRRNSLKWRLHEKTRAAAHEATDGCAQSGKWLRWKWHVHLRDRRRHSREREVAVAVAGVHTGSDLVCGQW